MLTSGWDLWFPDSDWESEGSEAGAAARGLHSDGGGFRTSYSSGHQNATYLMSACVLGGFSKGEPQRLNTAMLLALQR